MRTTRYESRRALLKLSFSRHSAILCSSYEGNPLSPPKGEAVQGEHPLDPLFFRSIIFNLIRGYRNMGDAQVAGAEARCLKSPQERLIVSMRVSHENLNNQI
jgi:hypothetical protein